MFFENSFLFSTLIYNESLDTYTFRILTKEFEWWKKLLKKGYKHENIINDFLKIIRENLPDLKYECMEFGHPTLKFHPKIKNKYFERRKI